MISAKRSSPLTSWMTGHDLLSDPLLNKGTAFTEAERDRFDLHGYLPPHIGTLSEQVARRLDAVRAFETDIERYTFLRELQDTNETLFFALLTEHLEELLPVIYTPTVGLGCQQFSKLFRRPRGLFLSIPHKDRIRKILSHPRFDNITTIVVTDGERILGLGDQGAGGMGISIGKLALYTACGGINPATTLPIILDVGTDNLERLADPLYIGWKHERVRGPEYDEFVDEFVEAVIERWPHVLLQWEDFAKANATRLLERYRDRLCTFNDDVQGTAAVATGTLLSAMNVTGRPLTEQRIAIFGAGSAGCGIASLLCQAMMNEGLSPETAASKFYLIDRDGLLVEGMKEIAPFQEAFLHSADIAATWQVEHPDKITLFDVVQNIRPTVLIGVSGQPGAFSRAVVESMCRTVERPVIFPLSNPTSRAEATPQDIDVWSDGRAIVGAGSPYPAIERNGVKRKVAQTNNSYVFPGIGLGAVAIKATHVSDGMMMAAAKTLATLSPARTDPNEAILPPVSALRDVAREIAIAVAIQAVKEGLSPHASEDEVIARVDASMWKPLYPTFEELPPIWPRS